MTRFILQIHDFKIISLNIMTLRLPAFLGKFRKAVDPTDGAAPADPYGLDGRADAEALGQKLGIVEELVLRCRRASRCEGVELEVLQCSRWACSDNWATRILRGISTAHKASSTPSGSHPKQESGPRI